LQKAKRVLINVFLGFHIVVIASWCLPLNVPPLRLVRNVVRPYFLWSGLFQSWDMFAPIPASANSYLEATIIYKDGTRKIWTFPRMEELSRTDRYIEERYRKFEENIQNSANDAIWPDVARHIARANSSPDKPVKTIFLIQHLSPIVPAADGSYLAQPWDQHVLFGYGVRPEDLR
jgi:hypothetical protein